MTAKHMRAPKARSQSASSAIALSLAAVLALGCIPAQAVAYAAEMSESFPETVKNVIGKAAFDLFGSDEYDITLLDTTVDLNASVSPHDAFSSEFLYFAEFESGNYDQGFSWEDAYHALGCYQFDNRYGLQDFLIACYNYDPNTFSMLAWLKTDDAAVNLASNNMYDKAAGKLTDLGQRTEDAWHAAYAANPTLFSRLQDGWFYQDYAETALNYCNNRGLNMDNRRDCVKGLVSGICNLFGSGGMRKFLGGTYGYEYEMNDDGTFKRDDAGNKILKRDANGNAISKVWPGAGLTGDMTDTEFVTALCDYLVANVAKEEFGFNQTYVHSYENRYANEKAICLEYLASDPAPTPDPEPAPDPEPTPTPSDDIVINTTSFTDVATTDWFYSAVSYVAKQGIMNGYGDTKKFGPGDEITRGQVVVVLWRMVGSPSAAASTPTFVDVDYLQYYGTAIRWARAAGIISGFEEGGQTVFKPDQSITRQDFALMLANFANKVDYKTTANDGASLAKFSDIAQAGTWAKSALGWAVDFGLISGDASTGQLNPTWNANRAEAAIIFMRYLEKR